MLTLASGILCHHPGLSETWYDSIVEQESNVMNTDNTCIAMHSVGNQIGQITCSLSVFCDRSLQGSISNVWVTLTGDRHQVKTPGFSVSLQYNALVADSIESWVLSPVVQMASGRETRQNYEIWDEDKLRYYTGVYVFMRDDASEYLRTPANAKKAYAKERALNYYYVNPLEVIDTTTTFTASCSGLWKPDLQIEWDNVSVETLGKQDLVAIKVVYWPTNGEFGNWYPPLLEEGDSFAPPDNATYLTLPYRGHLTLPYTKIHSTEGSRNGTTVVIWLELVASVPLKSRYCFINFAPEGNAFKDEYKETDFKPYGRLTDGEDDGTVIIWAGQKDPEEIDDNNDDIEPNTPDTPNVLDMGLVTTYSMTVGKIKRVGDWLWSANFFDNIRLLNNSPIENIISVKAMPVTLGNTGDNLPIILGNVTCPESARVVTNEPARVNIGTFTVPRPFGNFLDYRQAITIFLPFIGLRDLDPSIVVGRTFELFYIFDVVTGTCKAVMTCDGSEVYAFDGMAGIDIPITSNNRAQFEAGIASSLVSSGIQAGASLATGNPIGLVGSVSTAVSGVAGAQFRSITSGSPSPQTSWYESKHIYLIIRRPRYSRPATFDHTYGRPCNATYRLSQLNGFTKIANDCDLSGITASETLKEKLRDLLTSGIYC